MLTDHVDRYVALRQALGYGLRKPARHLHAFARFADAKGDTHIRTSTAVAWATDAPSPSARHIRLRDVVHLARFLHAEDAAHEVPPATLRLLSQILALMARQQTFVLYPESSELTTKQAAELLGVSRPFLIGILESGAIPHRKIGRHRRVLMKDVLAYKKTMQLNRRAALDELVKASEDAGGYDL